MDQSAVDALIELLDLEPIEVNVFRGRSPNEDRQRVFGGQVAGQALVAAARTVEGMAVHSLHSYFLVPGDPTSPILYLVDRLRDTRSFTTRRVVAVQHGRPVFELSASFQRDEQRPEAGFDHQMAMPTGLPDPESLPDFKTRLAPWKAQLGEWYDRPRPIDTRYCNWQPPDDRSPGPMLDNVWFRAAGRLPDDPVLHTCVVTYSSDFTVLDTSVRPHGPFRADDWLLYAQDTPSASGGRGLGRGMIFARDGSLVASVVQEGVIRPARRAD